MTCQSQLQWFISVYVQKVRNAACELLRPITPLKVMTSSAVETYSNTIGCKSFGI